jgi:hypothetical protein
MKDPLKPLSTTAGFQPGVREIQRSSTAAITESGFSVLSDFFRLEAARWWITQIKRMAV